MKIAAQPTRPPTDTSAAIGRYKLLVELGEGGMGVVWRALDNKTGGEVAIKIMKGISDPECLQLFTKEWKTLSHLCHPNIVDVRDVDVFHENNEQRHFFVMPLLRGITLAELIRTSSERLTCARVVEIFSQVCRGLQAAHQYGLIHRDLKPSNIFVMDDDTAKIIDFGVVHLAGTDSIPGQKGTFQYMSPEQIQMKEITPSADIFSLGVSLYEALTGRKPFARPTVEETIQAILGQTPPSVSEITPAIPFVISQVVHKCIAKHPLNRFSSARELAETLGKALRNEPIFDLNLVRDRLERIRSAIKSGDMPFASELLFELESEGHLNPEIGFLRTQIEVATKKRQIDHLLSASRARVEQGEIPLGLEKLRELLELDPDNVDALALKSRAENQRSETQALKWIELANTHLDNCDFAAARHAVSEALKSRDGEPRALELLRKIDSVEIEAKRIREQKEQLYLSALRDYQNGEIDSALSRLGRLFSILRSRPEGAVAERDAVYESFYKEVCSEHDLIRCRIEEAQRLLVDEHFVQALSICTEQLARYPDNGSFQTLKIQIEDAERQKISADLAITSKNADAEPDLDRRANIWREASERYPHDAQFAQQLKVACERRDLFNSIVARAHQFSEKGFYAEELAQWEMLRNIHPRYPGLSFELEQCRKRRNLQVRNEEKAHAVEEIVSLMEGRQFKRALERSTSALYDYPNDAELSGLEKLSEEGLERESECNRLFAEAQREAVANHRTPAMDLLKRASSLDPRNSAVQDALIGLLIDQGRDLLESDLTGAEAFCKEACSLNAQHRSVRSFSTEISNAARQRFVGQYLTQARGLVAMGEVARAWEWIQQALDKFPEEIRLQQFRDSLLKESPNPATKAAPFTGQGYSPEAQEDSSEARKHFPATHSEQAALAGEDGRRRPESASSVESGLCNQKTIVSEASDPVCKNMTDQADEDLAVISRAAAAVPDDLSDCSTRVSPRFQPSFRLSLRNRGLSVRSRWAVTLAIVCALIVSVVAARLRPLRFWTNVDKVAQTSSITVHLAVSPADSTIRIGGIVQAGGDIRIPVGGRLFADVSHPGYHSRTVQLSSNSQRMAVNLDAIAVRITVRTAEKNGSVEVDGRKAGDLTDGWLDGMEVSADGNEHQLAVVVNGRQIAGLKFHANADQPPVLSHMKTDADLGNMIVVSGMGSNAVIYGPVDIKNALLGGQPFTFGTSGTEAFLAASGQNELTYSYKGEAGVVSLDVLESPSLLLHSTGTPAELLITSNIPSATLTANGKAVRRSAHGWRIAEPGTYKLVLAADNYQPQSWLTVLKPKQSLHLERLLEPVSSAPAASSTLVISDGTPRALVVLDGKPLGELDENGSAEYAMSLSAGQHRVHFRKDGFCSERDAEVSATPPAEIHIDGVSLDACARITLLLNSQPATVKATREGDETAMWVPLVPGKSINLPAGTYQLAVESDGSNSYNTEIRLEAGKNVDFSPQLTPLRHCQLETPSDVRAEGDWMKPSNGNGFVYLSPGCINLNLVFLKPKANFIGRRRVEWILQTGAGRIAWTLDNEKISRKSTVKRNFDQHEVNVRSLIKADAEQYLVRIRVEGSQVVITNGEGAVLDSYQPQDPALHDLTGAKVGIRTSAGFRFSPE